MEGTCGTGRRQLKYFYYRCKNPDCGFKVSADEIEKVVITRIKQLALQDDYLAGIVKETNKRLQKELPQLKNQKAMLEKELDDVKSIADGLLEKWAKMDSNQASYFLKDKLDNLDKRRKEIEQGIVSLEVMIDEIERESVSAELVLEALGKFSEVFDSIEPYQQKELLHLILHKAILSPESIKIALYGRIPDTELLEATASSGASQGESRCETSKWLPRVVASRSPQPQVIQLVVKMDIRRSKRILLSLIDPLPPVRIRKPRVCPNTIAKALKIQAFINDGPSKLTWAQTRKELNISESKLAHLLKIVNQLPADFIENMKSCDDQEKLRIFTGRRLLQISRLRTERERRNEIERLLPRA